MWPAFEDWKRVLATIVAAERRNRSGPSVTLWDFSGYHAFATEAVPEKGDTETHMTWYWEAGHFKAALGEIMLRRILHSHGNDRFGVQLTTENVETVILRLRRGRQAYLTNRPDAGSHIRRFVGRYTNR